MNLDRLTKTLLAAIAIALWINAVNPWIQTRSALAGVDSDISRIQRDVHKIAIGLCLNDTICR